MSSSDFRAAKIRHASLGPLLVLFSFVAGCDAGPDRVVTHPTTGEIRWQGKPAAGVRITLYPTGDAASPVAALRPSGTSDENGAFALSTYETGDGAPAGEWKVTAVWPDPDFKPRTPEEIEAASGASGDSKPDKLRGKFSTAAASPWSASIVEGENALPQIDLSRP